MLGEIGRRIAKAEKKQILLFRKAEALISDIDVEWFSFPKPLKFD